MLSTFQIRVMVLIVALSHVVGNSLIYSLGSEIRSMENCFVHMADLTALKQEMANSTTTHYILIKLSVGYEKLIHDNFTNEKSVNSSESASDHCQVCLVNKRLFPSKTSNKNSINPFLYKEHREIHAICTLKPAGTTFSSSVDYSNRFFAICELINFEADFESIDYHAVETDPLGLCMNFTIPDRTNRTEGLQGAVNLRGCSNMVLDFFSFVFISVFIYYSPVFFCLFYPTEILQDGVTHIILEGASPVSLRSLAGNYFFSRSEGEGIWCKAKIFILRAFIIPLPFLISATFLADFEHNIPSNILLDNRLLGIVFGLCYFFQVFCRSCFFERPLIAEPCYICEWFRLDTLSCHEELPPLIMNHLRLQPLILVEYWRFCKQRFLYYFEMPASVIPSCRCSRGFAIRLVLFISLLLCIPFMAATFLTTLGLMTAPATSLCRYQFIPRPTVNSKMSMLLSFIIGSLFLFAWLGVFRLLQLAAYGAQNALVRVFLLSLSEEHLPYVACFVSVLYYIWSSYSSFTETYHELALALYDCYKDSKRTQVQDVPITSDQQPELPNNTHDLDNVMAIPKELFGIACEELLPLREGVYILILKITLLLSTVFTVFSWVTASSFDTTPLMKTLLAFLTFAFPKIVDMCIDGEWQKKMRERIMKEKVPKIVDNFIYETSMTTHSQSDRNANNDEVIFVNEDHIELEIMSP